MNSRTKQLFVLLLVLGLGPALLAACGGGGGGSENPVDQPAGEDYGVQEVAPTEEPAAPTEEPAAPTEEPAAPTEEPTTPTEEPAAPTEEPTTPTEEPAAPTEEPATPTEEPAAPSQSPQVSLEGFQFSPATLTVKAGTTVTWTNNEGVQHTVTADDDSFGSDTLREGGTFEFTFDTPGTYAYHCRFHGGVEGEGMSGVIVVTE